MAKVYAPNKQYTGLSASVMFVNGVGETADPHLIAWFESKGYRVQKDEMPTSAEPTVKQIKEQLDSLGVEYGAKDTKATLLELLDAEVEPKG